uniref:response regulator n=1 Tax=Sporomusa rhizae TaxID=357999 RepID=UPI003FA29702
MPGLTGLEVCEYLRKKGYQSPILMLSAKADLVDRVLGLDSRVDDYLVKPFELEAGPVVRVTRAKADFLLAWKMI